VRKTLVSVMAHPEVKPVLVIDVIDNAYAKYNTRIPYGRAFQEALHDADIHGQNLVVCDADGYHTKEEVLRLVDIVSSIDRDAFLVKPYRSRLGIQSRIYSTLFSLRYRQNIRDATSGLYGITYPAIHQLVNNTWNKDFSVHIQLLKYCDELDIPVVQYRQQEGYNSKKTSHRPKLYHLSLLKELINP